MKDQPLDVIAFGDFTTRTGLGAALNYPLRKLTQKGVINPVLLGFGFDGWQMFLPDEFQGFPILSVRGDSFGKDCVPDAIGRFRHRFGKWPDVVWYCGDVQRFDFISRPEKAGVSKAHLKTLSHQSRGFFHLSYFPIDGLCPGEKLYPDLTDIIQQTDIPVCCSSWIQKTIKRELGQSIPFIPHGVDTSVFYPIKKDDARRKLGIYEAMELPENLFIVGMIGTNQHRKKFEDFIPAMAEVCRQKSNVFFYLHTQFENGKFEGGHDILHLLDHYGLTKRCIDTRRWLNCTDDDMRTVYGIADVQVLLTTGEGFGIPPLYSRAMGIPCLVTDCTSLTENCADQFERLPVKNTFIDGGANLVRHLTNTDELIKKILLLADDRNFLDELGAQCHKFAQAYDYDKFIVPQWEQLLRNAQAELLANPPAGRSL